MRSELGERRVRAELVGVNHSFPAADGGAIATLNNVDLKVMDAEFISIIGPSGCGKTTIMNMIAGLIIPDSGSVQLDGEPVVGPQAGKVSYMFARDGLFPWRTAIDNVNLAMQMRRNKPKPGRAKEILASVGLAGFERHYPSQLSQGMRQRVALARTLAVEADLWLMDEPFAALDAHTRTLIQDEFISIWEKSRKTAILVTHDLGEAITLSDRVMVMTAGRARSRPSTRSTCPGREA